MRPQEQPANFTLPEKQSICQVRLRQVQTHRVPFARIEGGGLGPAAPLPLQHLNAAQQLAQPPLRPRQAVLLRPLATQTYSDETDTGGPGCLLQ